MSRFALAVVMVAASASVASAGAYIGLGLGTSPATSTSTSAMSTEADGRSGRLLLGVRFARLAIEGSAGRFDMVVNRNSPFESTMLGGGLKYSHPLGDNFEAFARGGLQRTYVTSAMGSSSYDASGNGYYLGGGVEYRLNLLLAAGSIFIDYQYAKAELTSDAVSQFDASNRMWTLGLTLSL